MYKDITPAILEEVRGELRRAAAEPEVQGEQDPLEVLDELEGWVEPRTGLYYYLKKKKVRLPLKQSWTRFIPGWDPDSLWLEMDGISLGCSVMIDPLSNVYKFQRIRQEGLSSFISGEEVPIRQGLFSGLEDSQVVWRYPWIARTLTELSLPRTAENFLTKVCL